MKNSDLIRPGDKIDIRLIQQVESPQTDGLYTKIYKSQVLDSREDGKFEISMPIESGKLMLLPLNIRFEFLFYSMGGMYRTVGMVVERYKKDNMYMLLIELKAQLERFQRREFFRLPYSIEIDYYDLTEKQAQMNSSDAIFVQLRADDDAIMKEHTCRLVDISGGGTRIRTLSKLSPGKYVLLAMRLTNPKIDKQYYIVGEILESFPVEAGTETYYDSRVKFMIKDPKVQEELIQFIFEEDRKSRSIGR
jgi:c-di-GMP-binding flagellar brake protein YcgR